MKAVIFDAFGTLFKVTNGGSARTILNYISLSRAYIDEKSFLDEWKSFYKLHTLAECDFMTEREIFVSRIQMFYDRYKIDRNAEFDAEQLLVKAYDREVYPDVKRVLKELMQRYQIFIGSNTDNDVIFSVLQKNNLSVHKVYTSENLKCYKPSPEFFMQIIDENALSIEDVLFVGDSVSDDIIGPKTVGIKTAWIDRYNVGGQYGQDYTISTLDELLEVLHETV